jgi:hypothetical protein
VNDGRAMNVGNWSDDWAARTLSSRGHARSAVDLEDPHIIRCPYDKWIAAVETARKVPAGFMSVAEGAATRACCATSPQLEDRGGVYCEDRDIAIAVPAEHPEPRGVRPWARDPEVRERLWRASEEWTGAQLV